MMARSIVVCALLALLAGSGCCCLGTQGGFPAAGCQTGACHAGGNSCGPACGGCSICLPKPIVWCGTQNECGPGGCETCACPTDCGILPAMRRGLSCGKGCGEIYWGEWLSDPPDCCDPCDQCHGQWTGPHGYCSLGPCQRLLAALHGYRYCPKPCCDEWCGLCNKTSCNVASTCGSCGGAGCATCGGGHVQHSPMQGEVIYEGAQPMPGQSIMSENWERQPAKPIPGKPIHKAEQPGQFKVGQVQPAQPAQPTYGRMVKTAAYFGR